MEYFKAEAQELGMSKEELCKVNWVISAVFSRGHATLRLAVSVGPSVRPSVRHISELRAVFALLLLPNRPRLDCRVSGLVFHSISKKYSLKKNKAGYTAIQSRGVGQEL